MRRNAKGGLETLSGCEMLDVMLVAWDCVVEDAAQVAMAARSPAVGQRDGLIPARKGAPEQ